MTNWNLTSEAMPESGITVLAFYRNSLGKGRRVRAQYIAPFTHEASSDDFDRLDCESDDDGEYYWPAGWYERIDNWDELTHVHITEGTVTHWIPLPAEPKP